MLSKGMNNVRKDNSMERVQKILMIDFVIGIALSLLVVVLGETHLVPFEEANWGEMTEFYLLYTMELATICLIPLALRLFRFKRVKRQLREQKELALAKWGLYRMDMLVIPMFICTVLYYAYMNATFGYLAIILCLSLVFVVPTKARCRAELDVDDQNTEKE